ncbi:hypothetical protein ACHAXR_006561 [Thalassiosira sp. AJA248-18]
MSKSPSLRRIKADIRELSIDPSDRYSAAPLEHDMFEWHFTIRGADDTDYCGGVYHGRILLPPEYPFKPPNIVFLTPSGRFETGVKVCLSFSAHHPELWQPAWGIRLILEALISFLPTPADGALGALDWTSEERKKLAKESVKFRCPVCCMEGETCVDLLPVLKAKTEGDDGEKEGTKKKKTKFQEEIEKLKMLQFQNHAPAVEEESEVKEKSEKKVKDDSKKSISAEGGAEEKQPAQLKDAASKPPSDSLAEPKHEEKVSSDPKPTEKKKSSQSLQGAATSEPGTSNPESAPQQTTVIANNTTIEPAPPVPANSGQVAPETPVNAMPAAVDAAANNNNIDRPMVSDSLLNGMIGFFAAIVIVLLRQAQSLVDELHGLGDENEGQT